MKLKTSEYLVFFWIIKSMEIHSSIKINRVSNDANRTVCRRQISKTTLGFNSFLGY